MREFIALAAVLLLSFSVTATLAKSDAQSLQPPQTPPSWAPPARDGPNSSLPVINGSVPMDIPPDVAVTTTIITTVTDDGKPTETTVQTVPGLSLPPQYLPHVREIPSRNGSSNSSSSVLPANYNYTAPPSGIFATDIQLAKAAHSSAAVAFNAAKNALQSAVLARQTAEAAASAARSAAFAAQAAIAQATHGHIPKDFQTFDLGNFPLGNPQPAQTIGSGGAANPGPAGTVPTTPAPYVPIPQQPFNGTQMGSKGFISPFFTVASDILKWPNVPNRPGPNHIPYTSGDDKVAANVISCKYSVETQSIFFASFQCQRKMEYSRGFCDVIPEDPVTALPRVHTIKKRCRTRAGVIMYPQCKHVFVRNPYHRNRLLHRMQCWSSCTCHITVPRWTQCKRQAHYCLGGFSIDDFPNQQAPLFEHCSQRYNGCVSECNIPYRACLSANALNSNRRLRECMEIHRKCTLKWAGSPSVPVPPNDPQNTVDPNERFNPPVLPTKDSVIPETPIA